MAFTCHDGACETRKGFSSFSSSGFTRICTRASPLPGSSPGRCKWTSVALRKEKRVVASPLGQAGARSRDGRSVSSWGSNGAFVRSRWISRSIHSRSFSHCRGLGLPVFEDGCGIPMMRKAFLQGRGAGRLVAAVRFRTHVQPSASPRRTLASLRDYLCQSQATVDIRLRFAHLRRDSLHGVGFRLELHERSVPLGLV